MKDLFYFISGIGVTVACELWRLGAVVRLHHTRNKNLLPLVQLVERRIWDAKVTRSNRVWEIVTVNDEATVHY